jgi:hypothetical protein
LKSVAELPLSVREVLREVAKGIVKEPLNKGLETEPIREKTVPLVTLTSLLSYSTVPPSIAFTFETWKPISEKNAII